MSDPEDTSPFFLDIAGCNFKTLLVPSAFGCVVGFCFLACQKWRDCFWLPNCRLTRQAVARFSVVLFGQSLKYFETSTRVISKSEDMTLNQATVAQKQAGVESANATSDSAAIDTPGSPGVLVWL